MNQMLANEAQDLYWFRHVGCPSPLEGDVALLVFICSVIGAAASSNYALEWSRWEWMRMNGSQSGAYTPYIAWESRVTIDPIGEHIGFVVCYMECVIGWSYTIIQIWWLQISLIYLDIQAAGFAWPWWASFVIAFDPIDGCSRIYRWCGYSWPIYLTCIYIKDNKIDEFVIFSLSPV
jgi:hypothetical protein